jgi:hypothetical protein
MGASDRALRLLSSPVSVTRAAARLWRRLRFRRGEVLALMPCVFAR